MRERGGGGAGRFIQRQGDGIFAKAFLQHKAFGGVDEFVQVFQALLAFFVGAVMLLQAAGVQHMFDGVAQALPGHGFAHHVDQGVKAAQLGPGRAADQGGGIQQAAAGLAGFFLQGFDAAGADAPGRKVHHAQKAGVVLRVLQQAQVGQGVLDFRAFKKAQAAIHAVGDAGIEQAAFQHAALGVAAVEQGDFLAREAVVFGERLDFLDQPTRFVQIGGRFVDAHRFARALVGGQVFAQALAVVFNQGVGAVQDVAVAAVVALQLDLVRHGKFAQKVLHIAHACAAKGVDALVIIAHGQHAAGADDAPAFHFPGQQFEPLVLQLVGVLKLIDQQVAKALLVVLAQGRVVAQQLVRAQQQFGKINHALALALVFVKLVQLDLFARIWVVRGHIFGAQAVFFATGKKPAQLLGRVALGIHVEGLAQPLDGRELVLHIQNLKRGWQPGGLVVRPQQAIAQAMKSAHPHAAQADGQQGGQARLHLFGRLVGEGDGHDAAGRGIPHVQQPGNARGQHPRFARTGPRQNQRMALGQGDGGQLLGVEAVQQGQVRGVGGGGGKKWGRQRHRAIVGGATAGALPPGWFGATQFVVAGRHHGL